MSGDVFQRAEFLAGYTAAFYGGAKDPARPPAWQDGFELFGKITVEPWQVERLVNYEPPIPPPDPTHPEFVVFTPPPYREPRRSKPKPYRNRWLEKKTKIQTVIPWLEEVFAIPRSDFEDAEKAILRRRFQGYTFAELGRHFEIESHRIRTIEQHAIQKIRNLFTRKGMVRPEVEDVRPRLVVLQYPHGGSGCRWPGPGAP